MRGSPPAFPYFCVCVCVYNKLEGAVDGFAGSNQSERLMIGAMVLL
jgi:hypothetical protein